MTNKHNFIKDDICVLDLAKSKYQDINYVPCLPAIGADYATTKIYNGTILQYLDMQMNESYLLMQVVSSGNDILFPTLMCKYLKKIPRNTRYRI